MSQPTHPHQNTPTEPGLYWARKADRQGNLPERYNLLVSIFGEAPFLTASYIRFDFSPDDGAKVHTGVFTRIDCEFGPPFVARDFAGVPKPSSHHASS